MDARSLARTLSARRHTRHQDNCASRVTRTKATVRSKEQGAARGRLPDGVSSSHNVHYHHKQTNNCRIALLALSLTKANLTSVHCCDDLNVIRELLQPLHAISLRNGLAYITGNDRLDVIKANLEPTQAISQNRIGPNPQAMAGCFCLLLALSQSSFSRSSAWSVFPSFSAIFNRNCRNCPFFRAC